jgi:kynureninase
MLCSTPQMLSMAAFEAALDAFDGIAMRDVQAKGRALGDLMIRSPTSACAARCRHRVAA